MALAVVQDHAFEEREGNVLRGSRLNVGFALAMTAVVLVASGAVITETAWTGGITRAVHTSDSPPVVESSVEVEESTADAVVLRFEATGPPDAWRSPGAADDETPELANAAYERTESNGSAFPDGAWSASARGPAAFSILVQVPDRGAVEATLESVDGAASELEVGDLFRISEPAIMRDVRLVRVTFSPAATSGRAPVSAAVLSLRATSEQGANEKVGRRMPPSPAFRRMYETSIVNYRPEPADAVSPDRGPGGRDPFGARYLIITRDLYEGLVEPLAEWKRLKGVSTIVTRLSLIGSSKSQIRAYITEAYNTWDIPPEFVLLVGDTEALPIGDGLTPTDNYYAAIDGGDYLADILIGRLSADTSGQCATQVVKYLKYERTPPRMYAHWPASATLMVADDYDNGDYIYYDNTWDVYDLMDEMELAPIDTLFRRNDSTTGDVYASVNAGKGFLNFRGQAFYNWNNPFDIDPYNLTNVNRLPVVVSATCGTGTFHHDFYVCEAWVRAGTSTNPKGGVAFFGSNTAIEGSQQLSRRRGYVCTGFFENAFGENGLTLGEACNAGKLKLYMIEPEQMEYEGMNLLGDPELSLWTADPVDMTVEHVHAVQIGLQEFAVSVTVEGTPAADALVALTKDGEVFSFGYTDATGNVSIPIEPLTPGELALTITRRNCYAYEAVAQVLDSGPFVIFSELTLDDSSGGNGDGYLSPGETATVAVELHNVGDETAVTTAAALRTDDPHATVTDSTAAYGTIPAGETTWGLDDFELTISASCPVGHEAPAWLSITFDGETIISDMPPIPIATGRFVYDGTAVSDPTPGGDGDGNVGPGETAGLVLTLTNSGLCGLADIDATLVSESSFVAVTTGHTTFPDAAPGADVANHAVPFVVSVMPNTPTGQTASFDLILSAAGHSYAYAETLDVDLTIIGQPASFPTGPDEYGYYAYDVTDTLFAPVPTYEWFDIAPPGPGTIVSQITDEDAAITPLPLPFGIQFYGTIFYWFSISSNGFVTAGPNDYIYGDNSGIPSLHGPAAMISPFWDDLDPSAGGDVYRYNDVANHRYIVQYEGVYRWGTTEAETFQVIIRDRNYYPTPTGDSELLFVYKTVTNPDECTVGIENPIQTDGIEYLFDGSYGLHAAPLVDGNVIRFTTIEPGEPQAPWLVLNDATIDDSSGGNGNGRAEPGETIEISLEFTNQGIEAANGVSLTLTSAESAITVTDSTAAVPNIPSGGTGSSAEGDLELYVSDAAADSIATLWALVEANGGAYQGSARFDLHIVVDETGIDDGEVLAFRFMPCFPNPTQGSTTMRLTLPQSERVTVRVYNTAGRLVKTVCDAPLEAGEHALPWDGTNNSGGRVASGVYLVRVEAGSNTASRKAVVLR
jgi:hypothetical protein